MRLPTKIAVIASLTLIIAFSNMDVAIAATPTTVKHVLILNSGDDGVPWQTHVNQSIRSSFAVNTDFKIKLHTEYTGLSQTYSEKYVESLIHLYQNKYKDKKIDLIITAAVAASEFMVENRERLFSGVPVLLIANKKTEARYTKEPLYLK